MQHRGSFLCLSLALGACALSTRQPEMLAAPEEISDAGTPEDAADAPRDAGSGPSSPTDAMTGTSTGGSAAPPTPTTPTQPAANSGSAGSAGSAGNSGAAGAAAAAMDADAGAPGPTDAGGQQVADDFVCSLEFAACLVDFLNFEACAKRGMCDLLTWLSLSSPVDAAVAPSPECALQAADCIMQNPDRAQECIAALNTCTL